MNTEWYDRSAPVRPGEELDQERLEEFLKDRLPNVSGPLEVAQFPKGYSNLTYLLRFPEQELVLRRPPFGANVKGGHDMGREYTILSHLVDVYPNVPRPLFYCSDESVLGASFYVMTRLRGIILRSNMPADMIPDPLLMSQIADSFIRNLVALHAVDYEAAGLAEMGRPQGYVQRQIDGWTRRYAKAQTDDVPEMDQVARWLAEHMPPETGAALIHNDYKYDNIVLAPEDWARIIGVLDWEMATIGDPLMDLGSTLGYWIEPGDPPEIQAMLFSPTTLPGNPSRAELVDSYAKLSGRDVSHLVFYFAYGLFKLGVIGQQIYYRYHQGYTEDPRFAGLIHAVRACGRLAVQAIEQGRIDQLVA
ncbi:MAG: phosphotransferase family protein [Candidatus Promineifilaceae bacterium]